MNNVTISGNICADARQGQSQNGNLYAFFTVAVNEKDKADFIPTSIFGKNTEAFVNLLNKLTKGTKILITGKLRSRENMVGDKKVTSVTVEVKEIEFLNTKTTVAVNGSANLTPPQQGQGAMPMFAGTPVEDDIPF